MTANPAMDPRTFVPRGSSAEALERLRDLVGDPPQGSSGAATGAIDLRGVESAVVSVGAESAPLPPQLLDALRLLVAALCDGRPVTVSPQEHMVTPHEAAELLRLSRADLDQLMESGRLPYRAIGRHHRILLTDVLAYHRAIHGDRAGLAAGAED
ncbi:helix-turn-helix domain-containing protein [Piscicoccus intestinalis]|uniref:helix-turn-helix domain-containing protein n=1 Tax=Piscicoccus intestinalis TaxID=746033 RepID=UPI00083890FC|nr:helix-turn-helix domain-containing protein [Piscicoccus intestinalis]